MADINENILKNILKYQEPDDIIKNLSILGLEDIKKDTSFWESCFLTRYGFSPKSPTLAIWNDMHRKYANEIIVLKDRSDRYGAGERCYHFEAIVRGNMLKRFIRDPDKQAELDHIMNYVLNTREIGFPTAVYEPYIEVEGYRPWSLIIGLMESPYGTDAIPPHEIIIDEEQIRLVYMRAAIFGFGWNG